MSYSLPVQDSDRIAFRVAARGSQHDPPCGSLGGTAVLTSAAEWRVTSVNSDAITPSTTSVKPQSYVRASDVQPVIINNTMIYVAARGGMSARRPIPGRLGLHHQGLVPARAAPVRRARRGGHGLRQSALSHRFRREFVRRSAG